MAGTKFILEPCITTLCTGAGFVALGFMRGKLALLAVARVVVNQGHASCGQDVLSDHCAAIGRVHQFVASIHPLGAQARERSCDDPAVMYARTGEHCADGHTAASAVQVQLVAFAADLVALRILLGARGASRIKFKEHLLQRLGALALQWTWIGGGAYFAFFGAPRFAF